jgi:hypothetical protein
MRWAIGIGAGRQERLGIELLPWCLLRSSGMPAGLLDGLASPELVAAFDELSTVEDAVAAVRKDFSSHRWPALLADADRVLPAGRKFRGHLYRAHKQFNMGTALDPQAVGGLAEVGEIGLPGQWNTLVSRRDELRAMVRTGFDAAVDRATAGTLAALRQDTVQHAIFVSNPSFFLDVVRDRLLQGRADDRQVLTAHRYLRRFATRCETTSFFGPVTFARLDPAAAVALAAHPGNRPAVFLGPSTWLVNEVHGQLVQLLPVTDRVVWSSPLFIDATGDVLERAVDGRRIRLPARLAAIHRAAGGGVLGSELMTIVGADPAELSRALRELGPVIGTGAVRLPATSHRPLDLLVAREPAGGLAHTLRERLTAFAEASWPVRVDRYRDLQDLVAKAGIDQRRHAGQHYADRELFHEDRSSRYSEHTVIGGPAVARLRDALSAALPLCYLAALLAREDARDRLRQELNGAPELIIRLARRDLTTVDERVGELHRRMADLVRVRSAGRSDPVELTRAEVDAVTADLWDLVPHCDRDDPCLPSPDLMLVGDDLATGQWLLAELHDDCSSVFGGVEAQLFSAPEPLFDEFTTAVAEYVAPHRMATIVSRRRSAHVTPELPGMTVELSGASGKPAADVRPIAAVRVTADARRLEVDGSLRQLYPGDLASPLHRAVSLPALGPLHIDIGPYTPRVVLDGLILQRARWRVALPAPAGGRFARWEAMMRLRRQHRLPDRLFLRHPGQPKPLFVDFADSLAVLDLARLGPAEVVFTELLPAPEDLWWRVEGERQCAELRLGLLIRGVHSG